MSARIRVLVAEDSDIVRRTIEMLLGDEPGIEIVGFACDGVEAVALAESLRPDVLTMDVSMPRLDGLEAIAEIMGRAPTRIIVVSAVDEAERSAVGFRAIRAGALELLPKPRAQDEGALRLWGRTLAQSIRLMAEVPVIRRRISSTAPAAPAALQPRASATAERPPIGVVGLAASTGGPAALAQLLAALPGDLPVGVLVAQHIADGFAPGLVHWLSGLTALRVTLAEPRTPCLPGHVYFPPDGHDLEVDATGALATPPCRGPHRPSGDRLLKSLARTFGGRTAAAVLTGMGDDGADGLLAVRSAGGVTFAQDEATSVVFGMPRAALERGGASDVVSLDVLALRLRALCERRSRAPSSPP